MKMFENDKGSYFGELDYDKETYPNAEFTLYWGDDDNTFQNRWNKPFIWKSDNHYYKALAKTALSLGRQSKFYWHRKFS